MTIRLLGVNRGFLAILIAWMSMGTSSLGHDPVEGLLYRVFGRVSVWTSKPPVIDKELRAQVRDDVLLCIGATNRTSAADYDRRYQAAGRLREEQLSDNEQKLLCDFLAEMLGGRDPLWREDINGLKSHICLSLIYHLRGQPANGIGQKLIEMVYSDSLDLAWRRECVQWLGRYYDAKWTNDSERKTNPERKAVEQCLVRLAADKRFAYEALNELSLLGKKFPEIKAVLDANSVTPMPYPPHP